MRSFKRSHLCSHHQLSGHITRAYSPSLHHPPPRFPDHNVYCTISVLSIFLHQLDLVRTTNAPPRQNARHSGCRYQDGSSRGRYLRYKICKRGPKAHSVDHRPPSVGVRTKWTCEHPYITDFLCSRSAQADFDLPRIAVIGNQSAGKV